MNIHNQEQNIELPSNTLTKRKSHVEECDKDIT